MKVWLKVLFLLLAVRLGGQSPLRFRADGTFRILQFTDIHWSGDPKYTDKTASTMRAVIGNEKPDLIVLTGDNVNTIPMRLGWDEMLKPVLEADVPWTVVFGNHDAEQDWENEQSFDYLKTLPRFFGQKGAVHGVGNFAEPILSHEGRGNSALLYFLDSNDYTRNPKLGSYAWIQRDQVNWYAQKSMEFKKQNARILPALMFFHIPLQEYAAVAKDPSTVGDVRDDISSSDINSGMFAAVLEQQDVMGIFTGHDHNNNFIGNHKGIALAYGSKTGNDGYGELEQGGRVIILNEGKFSFQTYISTPSGTKYRYSYPAGLPEIKADTRVLKSNRVHPSGPGLHYSYFEGAVENTGQILGLKPRKTGKTSEISLNPAATEDHFALKFEGYITVPETAYYRFYTYSDDGSVLKIDGHTIVDNDGGHSAQRKEGVVALEKGTHQLQLLYFEDYMGQVLQVGVSSINFPEQALPAGWMSH